MLTNQRLGRVVESDAVFQIPTGILGFSVVAGWRCAASTRYAVLWLVGRRGRHLRGGQPELLPRYYPSLTKDQLAPLASATRSRPASACWWSSFRDGQPTANALRDHGPGQPLAVQAVQIGASLTQTPLFRPLKNCGRRPQAADLIGSLYGSEGKDAFRQTRILQTNRVFGRPP